MARCERGYMCEVCGAEVEEIVDSDLYLGYVLGEVKGEDLLRRPERHLRCNRERAQYIVDEAFAPVACEGFFDKRLLDPAFVAEEEARITRAWQRLQWLPKSGLRIEEYPLPAR